jgi:hypothetical protein
MNRMYWNQLPGTLWACNRPVQELLYLISSCAALILQIQSFTKLAKWPLRGSRQVSKGPQWATETSLPEINISNFETESQVSFYPVLDTFIVTTTELSDWLQYSWHTIKHNSRSQNTRLASRNLKNKKQNRRLDRVLDNLRASHYVYLCCIICVLGPSTLL